MSGVRHLYVHLPFCAHRCGYCDFVTVVGKGDQHAPYVDALLAELERERAVLAPAVETVFLGGGTPTFTAPGELERLLRALPGAEEVTVEANPETVTPALAALLRANGVTRVSLGAQTFQPRLLEVLERRATPEDVRQSVRTLRDAGFDNVSLDLVYGIPGQSGVGPRGGPGRGARARARAPLVLRARGEAGHALHARARRGAREAGGRDGGLLRAGGRHADRGRLPLVRDGELLPRGRPRSTVATSGHGHNLGYWLGRDYLGVGIGAVSTVGGVRRRNLPSLSRYVGALARGEAPPREDEPIDAETAARERLLLGLRLDEPVVLADVAGAFDDDALARLSDLGMVDVTANGRGDEIRLTRRGRFLGGGVTAELLA